MKTAPASDLPVASHDGGHGRREGGDQQPPSDTLLPPTTDRAVMASEAVVPDAYYSGHTSSPELQRYTTRDLNVESLCFGAWLDLFFQ